MMRTRLPLAALCLVGLLLEALPAWGQRPAIRVIRSARAGVAPARAGEVVDQATADQRALDAAGLKADSPAGLLKYIRLRTLSDSDLSKIQAVIKRLGSDDFEERVKASNEVEHFGPAAVGPLRTAAEALNRPDANTDYEIAYRASECLRRMEKVPHAAVSAAVVRALAKSKPPGTAAALLAFLPLADDEAVADSIRATLIAVAVREGRAEPALVAALADPVPVRRAAAAVALLKGGAPKETYAKVTAATKAEKDPETKFRMLHALLMVSREKEAVGQLIDLLPELPRGRLWQAEDYLRQLAGSDAPTAVLGKSKESLAQAREAWRGWWANASAKTDLEKFAYTPRISGQTLLVLMDTQFGRAGAVVELGPDMKERWRITGLANPSDAQRLPDGTVAIAEQSSNRVTVRDTHGAVRAVRTIGGANRIYGNPQHVQRLANGNLLVVCRNLIVEFKKDKDEEVMRYVRPNNGYNIAAAHRLANGQTVVLLQQSNSQCIFLDDKGKEIPGKTLKTGTPNYRTAHIAPTADANRVLITEMNQVVEYDLKTGKPVWSKQLNLPLSAQRLPNGNTLIVTTSGPNNASRLVELAPDGEEVWSYQPTEPHGLQVFRAYRR
jgi:outer membrane protein assembly factor BamB